MAKQKTKRTKTKNLFLDETEGTTLQITLTTDIFRVNPESRNFVAFVLSLPSVFVFFTVFRVNPTQESYLSLNNLNA